MNGQAAAQDLGKLLGFLAQGHYGGLFVFENEANFREFMASPDPKFANLQRFFTLVLPFPQAFVLTLEQVEQQALKRSDGRYTKLANGDPFNRVYGGSMELEGLNWVIAPMFDEYSEVSDRWCINRVANDDNAAFQLMAALERDAARRLAFERKPQSLLAPTSLTMKYQRSQEAFEVDVPPGPCVFVPHDPTLPSCVGEIWKGQGSSKNRARLYIEDEDFALKSLHNARVDAYRVSVVNDWVRNCCKPRQVRKASRSVPLDILAAAR